MRASRGEERCQVEQVGAELVDVVEASLDPAEVAAVELELGFLPTPVGRSSQSRRTAHSGASAAVPLEAKRSGKIS
jgi:hypothetical protein